MSAQHTPGPWASRWHNGRRMLSIYRSDTSIKVARANVTNVDCEANARRIVLCCNTHDDLLEALEACAETLAAFVDDGSAAPDSVMGKDLIRARAALAKATGGAP